MSYKTLTGAKTVEGSIRNWVNWDKAPATVLLADAEATIGQKLRCKEMRTLVTGTIAIGATSITLPSGFRGVKSLKLSGDYTNRIVMRDASEFEDGLTYQTDGSLDTGTPSACTLTGDSILLNREADIEYNYRMHIMQTPTAMSTGNDTNFLSTVYPHMLRAACLYHANLHRKDMKEASKWQAIMSDAIQDANVEADEVNSASEYNMYWDSK